MRPVRHFISLLVSLCLLVSSSNAAVTFIEPGGDADFGIALWTQDSGTPAVATDFVRGNHVKSIKYRPGNQDRLASPAGSCVDAGCRYSFSIYLVALPNATATIGFSAQSGSTGIMGIKIKSTGAMILDGGTPSADSSAITTGVWYHFTFAQTVASTTVNEFRLYRDGALACTLTNATLGAVTTSRMKFGNSDTNSTLDFRSSDHYFDNSSALTDVGNIWVTAKRPVSNGTTNGFTTQIGAGGSGYGTGHSPQVNERPLSTTNGWSMIGAGAAVTEEYTIEGKTVGDINIGTATIVDYMGWIDAKTLSNETASIVVGGASSNVSLTTTITIFVKMAGSATYPAGGTDIGLITTTALTTVSLYEGGIVVAFIPAAAPSHSSVF